MKSKFKLLLIVGVSLSSIFVSCKDDNDDKDCQPATAAAAGDDQVLSGTEATLQANVPVEGTGTWSIVSGAGGSIDDLHDASTDFTGSAGTAYTLRWTISGCPESTDDVIITFTNDPVVNSIDKTTAFGGQILTITGINFSANYQGNSQIIARKAGSADTYLPIISFTDTEIKAVMAVTAAGTYNLVYWNRETVAAGAEFASDVDVTLNTMVNDNFFVGQALSTNSIPKGNNIKAYVKSGGTTLADYVVKLLAFDYTTGISTEFDVTEVSITAGTGLDLDELVFTIPADLPSGAYKVKVTNKGTAVFIAGYSQVLSVN